MRAIVFGIKGHVGKKGVVTDVRKGASGNTWYFIEWDNASIEWVESSHVIFLEQNSKPNPNTNDGFISSFWVTCTFNSGKA